MELKEISLAQLLNNTSGTDYFTTFAKLIGHSKDAVFYEGITDDDYDLLEEIEKELGYELPANYVEFLSYLNGGCFVGVELFSVTNKDYPNSIYARNFLSKIRKEIEIPESDLIIGKVENYILVVDCLDDASYSLMDIRNNEKIEFETFGSLIGFIFYIFILNSNKKIEEEKKEIQKMKDDLHKSVTQRAKQLKKERQSKNAKLGAKVAKKGLKEAMKKAKKR